MADHDGVNHLNLVMLCMIREKSLCNENKMRYQKNGQNRYSTESSRKYNRQIGLDVFPLFS
jgi:hypothetical protein